MYRIMKRFGDNLVLNNITFTIYDKERVALVGKNGSGKSTILKLLVGIEPLDRDDREDTRDNRDRGWVKIPKGVTVGYLNQLPNYPGNIKVVDILKLAFEEVYTIEKELRALESNMTQLEGDALEKVLKQYSKLQEVYEAKGGYDIDEKLSEICKGLKFDDAFLNKDFNILSGGEVIILNILSKKKSICLNNSRITKNNKVKLRLWKVQLRDYDLGSIIQGL
jgi:ATP-binding cassette subfamily F protein 3